MALTPAVQAGVIYNSATLTVTQSGVGTSSGTLDLNGDLVDDIQFRAEVDGSRSELITAALGANMVAAISALDTHTAGLAAGETIDSTLAWTAGDSSLRKVDKGGAYGEWVNDLAAPQYLGIQFKIGSETHYGWIQAATATDLGVSATVKITGYGYETLADTPITAGAGSPIPEPSTLALFALGAVGIAAMKRRRSRS